MGWLISLEAQQLPPRVWGNRPYKARENSLSSGGI